MNHLTAVFITLLLAVPCIAQATDEPTYETIGHIQNIELRAYSPSIQARTPIADDRSRSGRFRVLADYIFGNNATQQSIAMTAPVETRMPPDGYMAFTMPTEYNMDQLPHPEDRRVSLHSLPARRMAVIAFSGWATDGKVDQKTKELLSVLAAHDVETLGRPALNQYDPPWTPPWRRRNEVVVQLAD
ncbi:MAG: heme-binding protein [Halioglobus sp.]|nr:heme-binding protein [Halioglobus sp.]